MEQNPLSQLVEMTREQLVLLAAASESLADIADYETTLRALTRAVVPALADFCFLDVIERGAVRRIGYAHADELRQTLLDDPRWTDLARRDHSVALTRGTALHVQIDEAWLSSVASSPEQVSLLRGLAFQSLLTLSLTHQGRRLGELILFYRAGGRMHSASDLSVCEALARRAAAAIEGARLLQEARDAAGTSDDFLSFAGHELRTPLTALQLQLLSIERMLEGEIDAEKIRARTEKAVRNVVRLSSLLSEVLDVSRISAGKLTLQRTRFDLAELVSEVLASMADDFLHAGCVLDIKLEAELRGSWDRTRVAQVVTSLLSNASRYGPGKPIEVRLTRRGGVACLSVRDFGVGVSPDEQARMFERAVTARRSQGLGLGLWMARQLVEAHGGSLRVHSVLHEGATFELELALEQGAAHP